MCNTIERNKDGKIIDNCGFCGKEIILNFNDEELKEYNDFMLKEENTPTCEDCHKDFINEDAPGE